MESSDKLQSVLGLFILSVGDLKHKQSAGVIIEGDVSADNLNPQISQLKFKLRPGSRANVSSCREDPSSVNAQPESVKHLQRRGPDTAHLSHDVPAKRRKVAVHGAIDHSSFSRTHVAHGRVWFGMSCELQVCLPQA